MRLPWFINTLILINFFASNVISKEKLCSRNDQSYSDGVIITDNGKRYRCMDGKWQPIDIPEEKPKPENSEKKN
jgi:hypothetical protein